MHDLWQVSLLQKTSFRIGPCNRRTQNLKLAELKLATVQMSSISIICWSCRLAMNLCSIFEKFRQMNDVSWSLWISERFQIPKEIIKRSLLTTWPCFSIETQNQSNVLVEWMLIDWMWIDQSQQNVFRSVRQGVPKQNSNLLTVQLQVYSVMNLAIFECTNLQYGL